MSSFDPLGLVTALIYVQDNFGPNHVAMYINGTIYQSMPFITGSNASIQNQRATKNIGFDVPNLITVSPGDFFSSYRENTNITIHSVVLKVSSGMEKELMDYYTNNNRDYNLYNNNCAQFINSGLENFNLRQFNTGALLPNRFFNRLMQDKVFSKLIKNHHIAKFVSNINLQGDLE